VLKTKVFESIMPLLKPEQDIWPLNLLDDPASEENEDSESHAGSESESDDDSNEPAPGSTANLVSSLALSQPWWALYTLARFEKKLMRQLVEINIPFYGPTISRRYRSPQGRIRTSVEPLFPNYVFIMGDEMARYNAIATGSVSRCMPVADAAELVTDLRQIRNLILTESPLSPELRLQPGQKVRVKTGVFKGFEGVIIRRENEVRLLISVRYMGRGASVALDDCQLEAI
jgi:transcription antitermination factor NusG